MLTTFECDGHPLLPGRGEDVPRNIEHAGEGLGDAGGTNQADVEDARRPAHRGSSSGHLTSTHTFLSSDTIQDQEEWCARNLSIWGTQRAGGSVMYIYPGYVVSSFSLFPTFLVKNVKISGVSFTKGALWVISLISALIALCQDTFCSSFQPFSAPHKERKNPLKYREWRQWIF